MGGEIGFTPSFLTEDVIDFSKSAKTRMTEKNFFRLQPTP
jgi:hypothetical protein